MASEFDAFKQEIVKLATPEEEEPPSQRTADAAEIPFVFVNNVVLDCEVAKELAAILSGMGCLSTYQVGNGDAIEFRRKQRRDLLNCDGVIYMYGRSPGTWVQEQLRLLRKAVPRRKRPLKGIAVCEGPPGDQRPLGMFFPGMEVIDCRNGLSEDAMRNFLESIRSEDGR